MSLHTPRVLFRRAQVSLNRWRPDKPVTRRVRGVDIVMPRRHLLHYMSTPPSPYGLNLIHLAEALEEREGSVTLLDVGANVGDSALTVLGHVKGRAVCVEPDPQWLPYLERNTAGRDDITTVASILLPEEREQGFTIVHSDLGSTHIKPAEAGAGDDVRTMTTDALRASCPELADLRLVKTDTDGYDVVLAPALARTFAASKPVIFLEFELVSTRSAHPDLAPESVWQELLDLGYEDAVVWNNVGTLIGPASVESLITRTDELKASVAAGSNVFWDVAVAHRDDTNGKAVLAAVCHRTETQPKEQTR